MTQTLTKTITNPGLVPWVGSATYDATKRYRTLLTRVWSDAGPRCAFCMLNPSTATAEQNDPTVRRALGYAQRWGYGSLDVVNIFAYRATNPAALRTIDDPVGTGNDRAIVQAGKRADLFVAAWGNHGLYQNRAEHVIELLTKANIEIHCLNITKQGQPVHPLYQPADAEICLFRV